jgi:RNA-directed DNA polymerase
LAGQLLRERAEQVVGKPRRWLARLANQVYAKGDGRGALKRRWVIGWILDDPAFRRAYDRHDFDVRVRVWKSRPAMQPGSGPPEGWRLPAIATTGELADWLGVKLNELEWFADVRGRQPHLPEGPLRHYRYRWIKKRHGEVRLLEVPKPRLREVQRQVLRRILDRIPPHDSAHGFRAGRGVRSFVEPHVAQRVVMRLDLRDFFPTIRAGRILGIFLTAGYPEAVAQALARLCTHVAGGDVFDSLAMPPDDRRRLESLYGRPHLPQGAPASPALSNLAAYRLDCRLAALAASAGAISTRYADDLAFSGSGEFERSTRRFQVQVAAIALEEGFVVHTRKTRIMREGVRQQLAGVVVNRHPNLARDKFDHLKAILHNCAVNGGDAENRDGHSDFRSHLAGLVSYAEMINPARGRRLRALFERIRW